MKERELEGIAGEVYEKLVYVGKLSEPGDKLLAHIAGTATAHMLKCEDILEREGLTVTGQNLAIKAHPANDILKTNRMQLMQALKQLGLQDHVDDDGVLKDFE